MHGENVLGPMPFLAVQRSQSAAMDVKTRYLLRQLLGDHKDRHLRPLLKHIAQASEPALSKQERPWPVAGFDGAPDDLLTLSDKEPSLCLKVTTK
jgi:hypothetical protein